MFDDKPNSSQQWLLYIEEQAKKTLVMDEYEAIMRHIKNVSNFVFKKMYCNKIYVGLAHLISYVDPSRNG